MKEARVMAEHSTGGDGEQGGWRSGQADLRSARLPVLRAEK